MSTDTLKQALAAVVSRDPDADLAGIGAAITEKLTPASEPERALIAETALFLDLLRKVLDAAAAKVERGEIGGTGMVVGAAAAKLIAEAAKSEAEDVARMPLANAGVMPPLVRLLQTQAPKVASLAGEKEEQVVIQCLRALANLCYENESNRDTLLEVDEGKGIALVTSCLKSSEVPLLHTTCGALLNITMDNEPVQLESIKADGIVLLLNVIKRGTDAETKATYGALVPSAIRTLSNLLEIEKGILSLLETDGLVQLLNLIRTQHTIIADSAVGEDSLLAALEILEALTGVLEAIGENDAVQRFIVKLNLLDILLDFVDHLPTAALPSNDEDDEDVPDYAEIRKRISRIVTLVTMNDANMADIPNNDTVIERFKQWMTLGLHTGKENDEDEIRMAGALSIGNLARSDESCLVLVTRHNVGPALLSLLQLEKKRVQVAGIKEETKSSVK
ncbi:Rap1 GTPase-GDP dissociation stimulator 1, partial [Irineochytrium annulatum]